MVNLESQEEDAPKRVLYFKPMSWLGQIRPHLRDEAWSASFWQPFFAAYVGASISALVHIFQLLRSCHSGLVVAKSSP